MAVLLYVTLWLHIIIKSQIVKTPSCDGSFDDDLYFYGLIERHVEGREG